VKATYHHIKADILGKITRGEIKPGSLMPSEVELADTYAAARATVNRAMRELADEGIIERKRKSGSRVLLSPRRQARFDIPLIRREIEEQGATYRYELVGSQVIGAPDWLSARLGLPAGAGMRHVQCMHFAGEAPYQHEDRWINLSLLPEAEEQDFSVIGPNEWLVAQIPFTEADISILAAEAQPPVAALLACALGAPLLQIERSTRWNGTPVTFVRLVFRRGHRLNTRY
jgi:GntR family histidine utilization transcriptional repressor